MGVETVSAVVGAVVGAGAEYGCVAGWVGEAEAFGKGFAGGGG